MTEETKKRLAGLRIRDARKGAGLSQTELGKLLDLPQSVISNWENGELQSWRDHLPALAKAVNQPVRYFVAGGETTGSINTSSVRQIPFAGEVQGGTFRMAYEFPADKYEPVSIAAEAYPAYAGVEIRAFKVVGPVANKLYAEGTDLLVVSAADTDVRPGDDVVVLRRQGGLCETTIKIVRADGDRIALDPCSNHPDHQETIYLDEADPDGVEIAYVVIGAHHYKQRPAAPIKLPPRR